MTTLYADVLRDTWNTACVQILTRRVVCAAEILTQYNAMSYLPETVLCGTIPARMQVAVLGQCVMSTSCQQVVRQSGVNETREVSKIQRMSRSQQERARCHGFTLIELLIVIAIVALLMAIMLPALGKVREQAKSAVCLMHMKSMALSWVLYADDNDTKLTMGTPYALAHSTSDPSGYILPTVTADFAPMWHHMIGSKAWVGTELSTPRKNAPKTEKTACIVQGALYPYVNNTDAYWCPKGIKGEQRTFSIVDSMNGTAIRSAVTIKRLSQIKFPAKRFVFIDEGVASPGSWTINWDRVRWWDRPGNRHNGGDNFAYADGHAANYIYRDRRTVEFAELPESEGEDLKDSYAQNNPDFDFLQRGCWGEQIIRP